MSKKSKSLLHTLQQQTLNDDEVLDANLHNMSYDNSQIRTLIENGGLDHLKYQDQKNITQLSDLHKDCIQLLYQLNDQSVNYQLKQISNEQHLEPQHIVKNIKVFFQILIQEKIQLEQILQKQSDGEQCDYEKQLQKLEAEVRQHIRIEQQLKIYAETTQAKLEDQIKISDQFEVKLIQQNEEIKQQYEGIKKFSIIVSQYESEIIALKNEAKKMKQPSRPTSKKEFCPVDTKPENQQKHTNLPLDRLTKQETHKLYRIQTEPTEEFYDQNENQNQNNQQRRLQIQQLIQDEGNQANNKIIKQLLNDKRKCKLMTTQTSLQTKVEENMKRNGSNKQYLDCSYSNLQKFKQESSLRQKSLSKYVQNSVDGQFPQQSNLTLHLQRTKNNSSTNNTIDMTNPSFLRPFQSTDQPLSEIDGYANEVRAVSRLQDGRMSAQGIQSSQNSKPKGEAENTQQMKNLIQNYHLRHQNENCQINKIVERQKKYASKSQHY